jgi:tetratricopeptide (TPR) repeat protein
MPNWCASYLAVEGPPRHVTRFLRKAAVPVSARFRDVGDDWHGPGWRVFYNLYPVPAAVIRRGCDKAGRDWMAEHWSHSRYWPGLELRRESSHRARLKFLEAYGPPTPWVARVAADHPELAFDHSYGVECGGPFGLDKYRGGKWVEGWMTEEPLPGQHADAAEVFLRCSFPLEATDWLTRAIRQTKAADGRLYLQRAQARLALAEDNPGDYPQAPAQALRDLRRAVELGTDTVQALIARGRFYEDRKRFDQARADFDAAVRAEPHSSPALVTRGYFCRKQEDPQQALADAERAIQAAPLCPVSYCLRGLCYLDAGNPRRAASDFTRLLQLDPGYSTGHLCRGHARLKMKQYEGALADAEEARFWEERLSWFGEWYWLKGECLAGLRRLSEAVEVHSKGIDKLQSFDDHSGWLAALYFRRAIHHAGQGRHADANADFSKAAELDPSYSDEGLAAELARRRQAAK